MTVPKGADLLKGRETHLPITKSIDVLNGTGE